MVDGLRLIMSADDLERRIRERIREHESVIHAIEERLTARAGDASFDVRSEDDFKTVGELRTERDHLRGRVLRLAMIRDNLVKDERYTLTTADLRLAELMPSDSEDQSPTMRNDGVRNTSTGLVDGLKLTFTGAELHEVLQERIDAHLARAAHWRTELARTPDDQTEDHPLVPGHLCECEAERHDWRVKVLSVIRDHVDRFEVFRLGEGDLAFGELLPENPRWLKQEEYEERTGVAFNLERLTRRLGELDSVHALLGAHQEATIAAGAPPSA